jgi:hypothetical protein
LRSIAADWFPLHQESDYSDFNRYALQLRDNSHDGPVLAATKTGLLIFGGAAGQTVTVYDAGGGAREFRSAWFENNGNGAFTAHFLPPAGQTAPLRVAAACWWFKTTTRPRCWAGGWTRERASR